MFSIAKLVELNFHSGDFFPPFHYWMINFFVSALGTKLCENF